MEKLCSQCGNPLSDGTKFCSKCGVAVSGAAAQSENKQKTVNTEQSQTTVTQPVPAVTGNNMINASTVKKTVNILGGGTLYASPAAGEIAIGGFSPLSGANIFNPIKTVLDGVKRIFTSFKNVFKNKKGLIAAIVLTVVWILLILLPMLGINPLPVKLASWLTFAQGGLKGNVLGFIGGILGKGMFATLIFSLLSGGSKSMGGGLKKLFSGFKSGSLGMTFVGIGTALVLFNLMAGVSSPIQSMAGISGFLLTLRSLGEGGGFIRKFAISLTANKNGKTRTENTAKCTALLSGLSLGFAAGTALSFIPWGYVPYCVGVAVIIAGVILGIVRGKW